MLPIPYIGDESGLGTKISEYFEAGRLLNTVKLISSKI